MSAIGLSKSVVRLDLRKAYPDAFKAGKIHMYIPRNNKLQVVSVENATWLECWKTVDGIRDAIPYTLSKCGVAICNILIKNPEDAMFANLSRSVAFGSLAAMDAWLRTVVRYPDGDLLDFVLYNEQEGDV